MSRLYDTLEPSVMDKKMLQQAVEEQGPQDQAGQIAKEEGVLYEEVCQLCLNYRNILKIDHLWQFTSLTKLQLDNNIIVKIEGLECLTNLKWLDLSFNNIEVIEGLNSLVLLEDLSLYNNRISVIENMDTLLNLHILSLGNNLFTQLENREQAHGKYQYAIEEMRHNETQERKAIEAKKEQEDQFQLHMDAFVEHLNGPYLFDSMYADDAEAAKLSYLPGVPVLLETFKSQLVELCMQMFEVGLAQHGRREDELKSFFDCSREAVEENQQRAAQSVADFERARRQVMSEMQQATDPRLLETQLNHCNDEINQLCDSLMTQELQLVDQLEDIIKDFERDILDMVAGFVEVVQGIFAQCRDLENHHHEKLLEIAVATLEQVAKNELEEDMPDDVRMLFVDKDTVINAVSASHDTHLLKIDNREDELVTRVNSWISALIKSIQDKEVKRNRKRIAEIHNYIDYVRDQLSEMRQERWGKNI
ncbi:dynein regulatory complex subunit 3 isoform X4 [Esox lucius]|uniref:dynein regulatory complex subunit 3 isoform X4 n=1 Tax=Esox lucius TaxID=8010 RepID=UPI0014777C22|nr:dynein regulatory complex subunit 3 isoform X4 [Esox lucius]